MSKTTPGATQRRKVVRFREPVVLGSKAFVRVWIPLSVSEGARNLAVDQDRYLSDVYADAMSRYLADAPKPASSS